MRRELALFRKVVALLKKIPVDFGLYEVGITAARMLLRVMPAPPISTQRSPPCQSMSTSNRSTPLSCAWMPTIRSPL